MQTNPRLTVAAQIRNKIQAQFDLDMAKALAKEPPLVRLHDVKVLIANDVNCYLDIACVRIDNGRLYHGEFGDPLTLYVGGMLNGWGSLDCDQCVMVYEGELHLWSTHPRNIARLRKHGGLTQQVTGDAGRSARRKTCTPEPTV